MKNVHSRFRREVQGFTLMELVATIAIVALLATLATPSFKTMLMKYRLESERSAFKAAVMTARDHARNGSATTLCTSSNGTACTAGAWRNGYIVFTDAGTIGTVDGTDQLLLYNQAAKPNVTITATEFGTSNAFSATSIRFGSDGAINVAVPVLFTICQQGALPQQVVVRRNGFITSPKANGTCP